MRLMFILFDNLSSCRENLLLILQVRLRYVLLDCHVGIDVRLPLGWRHFVDVDGAVLVIGERKQMFDFVK
jgi:hypothetical protein